MLKTSQSWNDNDKPRGSNFRIRLIETNESWETDLIYVLTGGGLPPVYLQAGIRRKPTRECVCGVLKGTRCHGGEDMDHGRQRHCWTNLYTSQHALYGVLSGCMINMKYLSTDTLYTSALCSCSFHLSL